MWAMRSSAGISLSVLHLGHSGWQTGPTLCQVARGDMCQCVCPRAEWNKRSMDVLWALNGHVPHRTCLSEPLGWESSPLLGFGAATASHGSIWKIQAPALHCGKALYSACSMARERCGLRVAWWGDSVLMRHMSLRMEPLARGWLVHLEVDISIV